MDKIHCLQIPLVPFVPDTVNLDMKARQISHCSTRNKITQATIVTHRDGYCRGRYASYWNAFLFFIILAFFPMFYL